ncbi:hypothetical protein HNV08_07855 [Winogradskyella eckloniae]|uniref:hypothetical protein n=1 Tax=Winogradskyella eckloniae TaxID=1089306 RepID=UPI0015675B21|nr:hypothetical protein [Winogradskyella eckloniae]NRD19958.1 hypothetical protein [Winogradskyella eckloniae]
MSISESNIADHIIFNVKLKDGIVYFLNHLAVLEFHNGVHVDLSTFKSTASEITTFFGTTKPFGLITNKVNSYSVEILDIKKAPSLLPNLSAYGIVTHNNAGKMNAIIESQYCKWKNICFDNLYEGINSVYQTIKNKNKIALN